MKSSAARAKFARLVAVGARVDGRVKPGHDGAGGQPYTNRQPESFETRMLQKSELYAISISLANQAAVARAAVETCEYNLSVTRDGEAENFLFESAVTH
jgi:hypothetical protein